MGNSQPPSSNAPLSSTPLPGGRSTPREDLKEAALRIDALLGTKKYNKIIQALLQKESGEDRKMTAGAIAQAQLDGMGGEASLYAPLEMRGISTSNVGSSALVRVMNINLQTHHSKTYKELSEIPLAEWGQDHIRIARRVISIDCLRKFEKPASQCSDGQVRSRLVKLLGHFNQLKVLALESDTAAISIERARARVDQIAVRRQSTPVIRKTGLDIRRVLGWFGLVRR